jgi:uncharacterized FlaG/YvyC family protein
MRATTSLAILLVTTALAAQPAFAKEGTESREEQLQAKLTAQREATRALAHKMMGHINLASVALDTRLPEAAQDHVKKAESLAAQLRNSAPEVQEQMQFKYGKVSYTVDDQSKNYYVPVVDDLFLLSEYKNTFHTWKESADIDETDAGVVWLTLSIDIREAEKALQDAEAKIEAKDYKGASDVLAQIFKDALVDEVVFTDPIWAVHDNLALAKNLIDEEHYDGARYALEHARKELGKLEKDHAGQKGSESFKKMSDQIAELQGELKKKDPSVSERVHARFAGWTNTVESWFSD